MCTVIVAANTMSYVKGCLNFALCLLITVNTPVFAHLVLMLLTRVDGCEPVGEAWLTDDLVSNKECKPVHINSFMFFIEYSGLD